MLDKIASIVTSAFIVTGVGIALRPGAPTPRVLDALFGGIAKMQTAAYGPR